MTEHLVGSFFLMGIRISNYFFLQVLYPRLSFEPNLHENCLPLQIENMVN